MVWNLKALREDTLQVIQWSGGKEMQRIITLKLRKS